MRKKWFVRAMLLAVIVLAAVGLDPRMIVRTYTVETDKLDAPVRLAVVADFHGCNYGKDAARLVQAVVELQPDAVLLPGDIFDDNLPWDDSAALVRSLGQRWPCYYVSGNHECWTNQLDSIEQILTEAGVTVLNRSCAVLEVNGQQLNLCGIPDPYANAETERNLTRAAAGAIPGAYTILLAHRPELIDQYAANGAFDLVVAGHAHGGQVRIPFLVNGLYAPNQGWFPKYAGGRYEVDGTTMIVSRGLARESTLFPRVFNRPELVLIELRPSAR